MALSKPQKFQYFLVLDFEATCIDDEESVIDSQEVIEFPVMKVNGKTFEVEETFHKYVRPKYNPVLTAFCTDLTGITQDTVDSAAYFEDVWKDFERWMKDQGLEESNSFAFVTCGDWDLMKMLPKQAGYLPLEIPSYLKRWINIKKEFERFTGVKRKGIKEMLNYFELKFEGRLHSGIDDVRNIVTILRVMANQGHLFDITKEL